jgi:hypothetical protein
MDFKEQGLACYRFGGQYPGIEPLEVADLKDTSSAFSESGDLFRFLQSARDGLLEKNIYAMGESLTCHFRMAGGGYDNAYGANGAPHFR